MTRYRMRVLGDRPGVVREFETPEEAAAVAREELRATRGMFIIKAVELNGAERQPNDEEANRFQAAMRGE